MSCGELGKGAKTGEEVMVCCGEFETCREMCAVRADRFKWQRDGLLAAIKRAKYWMAGSEAKRILDEAIASAKGGAA